MFRVLHIMAGADAGGISAVVLNYYRFLDRDKIHFDLALTTDMIGKNAQEFQKLGSHIYRLPLKSKGIKRFESALADLLEKEHFDAVHVHENSTSYVALRVAKRMGIKYRFAHAHTAMPSCGVKNKIKRVSGIVLNRYYATKLVCCGHLAGKQIFGKHILQSKKGIMLPNAIDTYQFSYDVAVRNQVRQEINSENTFLVGMVGRLSYAKNYPFALQLLREYHKIDPDARLLIVGNGEDEAKIRSEIQQNKMSEYVQMMGRRSDVERLYQAFDVLLMPSHYEGFPVAAVEAMATGLPILMADTITPELKFGSAVEYLPLSNMKLWIKELQKLNSKQPDTQRSARASEPIQNGLDIRDTARILQDLYLKGDI